MVELRVATVYDLPFIFRGERRYVSEIEPANESAWLEAGDRNLDLWIENLERTHVATEGGAAVGYAMWMWDGARANVVTVHVLEPFRRRGIGRQLLDALVSAARSNGAQVITLGAHVNNGARLMYEQAGFKSTGQRDDYVYYQLSANQ